MFVVTDGSPNDSGDFERIKKLREKNPHIKMIGLYTSENMGYKDKNMKTMFGKYYYHCKDMAQASKVMTTGFKDEVVRYLKK